MKVPFVIDETTLHFHNGIVFIDMKIHQFWKLRNKITSVRHPEYKATLFWMESHRYYIVQRNKIKSSDYLPAQYVMWFKGTKTRLKINPHRNKFFPVCREWDISIPVKTISIACAPSVFTRDPFINLSPEAMNALNPIDNANAMHKNGNN